MGERGGTVENDDDHEEGERKVVDNEFLLRSIFLGFGADDFDVMFDVMYMHLLRFAALRFAALRFAARALRCASLRFAALRFAFT